MRLDGDTDGLLQRAGRGDGGARERLFARYRDRLLQMVRVRMDPRLRRRIDPSDVVQDSLLEAWRSLPEYLRRPPLPFYPWLRQLAWQRLIDLHRQHLQARKRAITREVHGSLDLPDPSSDLLVRRLAADLRGPERELLREEMRVRLKEALAAMKEHHREVLVLRFLEGLSVAEAAAVLGIREVTLKKRQLRALQKAREALGEYAG